MKKFYTPPTFITATLNASNKRNTPSFLGFKILERIKRTYAFFLLASLLFFGGNVWGQNTYKLITSTTDLVAGEKYLIGSNYTGTTQLLSSQNTNNRAQLSGGVVTITSSTVTVTPASTTGDATKPYEITIEQG